jgi:molybdate transport system ATP-binding protein
VTAVQKEPGAGGDGHRDGPGLELDIRSRRGSFELELALAVPAGRTLALIGPNGAGKSTTIGCIAGSVGYEGEVRVAGRSLEGVPVEARRVGTVFQDYLLFPHLTVLQNVAFGPRSHGRGAADADRIAGEWLARLDVGALAAQHPRRLSGGQQQRVALARALAAEPDVLLLDEPLAALDVEVRADVRVALREHLDAFAGPTVLVTHSIADVEALADEVAVIEGGRVVQHGDVAEVVRHPGSAWMRRLVAARA